MKTGKSLTELAAEIERQAQSKKDYIADSRMLAMDLDDENHPQLAMARGVELDHFGITPICHDQIGTKTGIPAKYYDRMLSEAPELLSRNVNHWLHDEPSQHLVRTLDGRARAFLSDRYRPLDNYDLASIVLPRFAEMGVQVQSCELTESRLYLKAVTPKIQTEVRKGDVVQAGLCVRNSEVGLGGLAVEPLLYRLICLNGAIMPDYGMKKYHVGRGMAGEFEGAAEFFRDATRIQDDRAFWMKIQDVVSASLKQVTFDRIVNRWREATEKKIVGDPVKVVEVTAEKFGLSDTERGGVLRHLIEGKDLSAYGLMNAITREAEDVESYDRATELETIGPKVIELPKTDWQRVAEAA